METIVGSLVGVSYHTHHTVYDLIFTTERVIAFLIKHPSDISWQTSVEELFIGNMISKRMDQLKLVKIMEERRHRLQGKTPDELVAIHPLNFEVRYDMITSVEVKRQFLQPQLILRVNNPLIRDKIIRFNLSKKQIPDAQRFASLVSAPKTKLS
jgi:hypothetical protein